MEILKLINNDITIDPHVLNIKQFADIWNSDTSKDKKEAKKKLSCIYFFCKPNSIYSRYDPKEREEEIAKDVLENTKFTKDIKEGIEKYNTFKTVNELLLESQLSALNKSVAYYDNVDYTERDDKGKPVYIIKEVHASIKESKGITATIKDLIEQLKKEQESTSTIRGGAELGMFEESYD